jgi:hypothetical protein
VAQDGVAQGGVVVQRELGHRFEMKSFDTARLRDSAGGFKQLFLALGE